MSLWIPRLEWNDQTISGTTAIGSPTITGISSTASINAGMIASGAGVPLNSVVVSKTASSVTLNNNCTAAATVNITFFERYDFEFPPTKDTEERLKPKQTVTDSLDGTQQITTLFLEATRELEFGFVSQNDADKLKDNFYFYAYKGYFFRYFPDKDELPVFSMQLERFDFSRTRQIKKHPYFKYSIGFTFRRRVE